MQLIGERIFISELNKYPPYSYKNKTRGKQCIQYRCDFYRAPAGFSGNGEQQCGQARQRNVVLVAKLVQFFYTKQSLCLTAAAQILSSDFVIDKKGE